MDARSTDDVTAAAGPVVVGVDGSAGGRAALATAWREAVRRGLGLLVVTTVDLPDRWAMAAGGLVDGEVVRSDLRSRTEAEVAAVGRALAAEGVDVPLTRVAVLAGSAADALCRAAEGASLLVVGHRGRGGVGTRLIGSVGLGVVVHAPCPVLVVRPVGRPAAAVPAGDAAATT